MGVGEGGRGRNMRSDPIRYRLDVNIHALWGEKENEHWHTKKKQRRKSFGITIRYKGYKKDTLWVNQSSFKIWGKTASSIHKSRPVKKKRTRRRCKNGGRRESGGKVVRSREEDESHASTVGRG